MTEDSRPTPQQVLDLALPANDSGASTVRGYLIALLHDLWREEAAFHGHSPFGNSGWQYDIYVPMARAGWITITFDDDDYYVMDFPAEEHRVAESLVLSAIRALGESP